MDIARSNRGQISVQFGAPDPPSQTHSVGVCMVGVCHADAPWLSDRFPHAVIRRTLDRAGEVAIEHIRVTPADNLQLLPGLAFHHGSLIRDSVRLAFAGGAPDVDLLIARAEKVNPWDLNHPVIREQLDAFLYDLPGALLTFPDLPFAGARAMMSFIRTMAPNFAQRFQIGLLDTVPGVDPVRLARTMMGADVALCNWKGSPERMNTHGWRSCAAGIAGTLVGLSSDPAATLQERSLYLPPGRTVVGSRAPELLPLSARELTETEEDDTPLIHARLLTSRDEAIIQTEGTLREPVGEWPLPALRTAKYLHRLVLETAESFVFRTANDASAFSLANALEISVNSFVERGMLVGPSGSGGPDISGSVERSFDAPSLSATFMGSLRPWSQTIAIRVMVRPGGPPQLEVV